MAVVLFVLYAVPFVLLVRMIDYLEREPLPAAGDGVRLGRAGGDVRRDLRRHGAAEHPGQARLARSRRRWGPAVTGAGVEEILKVLGVVAIALVARARSTAWSTASSTAPWSAWDSRWWRTSCSRSNAVAARRRRGPDRAGDRHVPAARVPRRAVEPHAVQRAGRGRRRVRLVATGPTGLAAHGGRGRCCSAAAWGFHFLWNSPLLADGFGYGAAGRGRGLLVKGIPALLVGDRADGGGGAAGGRLLRRPCSPGWPTHGSPPRTRSPRWCRRGGGSPPGAGPGCGSGRRGARAVRRLQRAQAQLAVALSRDPGAEVLRRRRDVLSRRPPAAGAVGLAASGTPRGAGDRWRAAAVVVGEALVVALVVLGLGLRPIRDPDLTLAVPDIRASAERRPVTPAEGPRRR